MNEEKNRYFTVTDKSGKTIEYEILFTFDSEETRKSYIVFTDNSLDEEGNMMKVYTVPLETKGGKPAVWDDIGTAEAYLKLIKDVANEFRVHGNTTENKYYGIPEFLMNDFANNTDLQTGIVYDSEKARNSFSEFCKKYNVDFAEGNIFVASPN